MINIKFIVVSLLFYLIPSSTFGIKQNDSLLNELDQVLLQVNRYDNIKEDRILSLKADLKKNNSVAEQHQIYFQLYKEYETFIYDSALYYVKIHLDIAEMQNDKDWITECKIELARMYSVFAQFSEAIAVLKSINKSNLFPQQLADYYSSFAEVYYYWGEYTTNDSHKLYNELRSVYQDSALMVLPVGTFGFDINYGRKCIENGNLSEAERTLLPYLSKISSDKREYAILCSLIATYYKAIENSEKQKEFLIKSSITDIRASIKENMSIRTLAFHLLNDGEVGRANQYIKKSLEDANFFNARLQHIQIAKVLLVIDKAYQIERIKHQKSLQISLLLIGLLATFLIIILIYLIKQMANLSTARKELIQANIDLKDINRKLSESNHIKEHYIGYFLNHWSLYIDRFENYQKVLNNKVRSGKIDELTQLIKSSQMVEDELIEFYQNFDSIFIKLFPSFVDKFNKLLPIEEKIIPKNEKCLTVELRIFALIRLGITDSATIAGFLRCSLSNIYNYRSKYRIKSLIPREKFEETVMKIG